MDRPMGMLRGVERGVDAPKSIKKGTIPRIWAFARPYRGWLVVYLLFTIVSATVGVLTPVLAGRVVNAIVAGGEVSAAAATVVGLAAGIAALAIVEAVVGLVSRWFSSRIG
jgi:ABC-type multidrug transport system fused ATPase/permease subunit